MVATDEPICGTCAWWDTDHSIKPRKGFVTKECRRHAPVAQARDGCTYTTWPTTTEYQFCGDWEAFYEEGGADDVQGL